MTVRERAYAVFSRLDDDLEKRTRAFNEIDRLTHPIENLDYDKELAEYREERYGK